MTKKTKIFILILVGLVACARPDIHDIQASCDAQNPTETGKALCLCDGIKSKYPAITGRFNAKCAKRLELAKKVDCGLMSRAEQKSAYEHWLIQEKMAKHGWVVTE